MRTYAMSALALVLGVGAACGQQAGGAATPPAAPAGKAGYFARAAGACFDSASGSS